MAATASVKNSPETIEWMAQTAYLRKATTVKKNERPVATYLYKWNNTLL